MSVFLPASHLEPGVVECYATPKGGILDVGRFPAGVDATVVNKREFRASGLTVAAHRGAEYVGADRLAIQRFNQRKAATSSPPITPTANCVLSVVQSTDWIPTSLNQRTSV